MSLGFHVSGCVPSGCEVKPLRRVRKFVQRFLPEPAYPQAKADHFTILREEVIGPITVAEIQYPECKNYEGRKILVYQGIGSLAGRTKLDPHFCDHKDCVSPIARFVPTVEGWELACSFAEMISVLLQPVPPKLRR